MRVNEKEIDLRDIWQQVPAQLSEPLDLHETKFPRRSRLPGERLRRRLYWDALFKLLVALALPAAFMVLDGKDHALAVFMAGLFILSLVLGIWQLIWVHSWPPLLLDQNLSRQLSQDLSCWNRRLIPFSFLLGATPALVWQLHQLVYYAFSKGRLDPSGTVAWLFALAGGPVLWLIASWVSHARLNVWLIQIEQALKTFSDPVNGERMALARKTRNRRVLVLVMILISLMVLGLLFLLA